MYLYIVSEKYNWFSRVIYLYVRWTIYITTRSIRFQLARSLSPSLYHEKNSYIANKQMAGHISVRDFWY